MSMKKLAADGQIKKVDKYRVPVGMLHGHEDNIRLESKENREHVDAIFASLMVQFETDLEPSTEPGVRNGSMQLRKGARLYIHDMEVLVDENDHISVVDGNSSLRALHKAIKAGRIDERFLVDVVPTSAKTRQEVKVKMILCGQAKEPSPLEFGIAMKDLRDDPEEPWSIKQLADRFGRTTVSVRTLLQLADADPRIHQMIADGNVGSHFALDALKEHGPDTYDYLVKGLAAAADGGKAKLTAATVKGRALPSKVVKSAVASIETFHSSLDRETRLTLARLESLDATQLQGRKVELDAALVLALLKAGSDIDEERKRAAAKEKNDAQAATQGDLIAA